MAWWRDAGLAGLPIRRWLVAVGLVVAAGTGGYVVLEGWSVPDAFYMTVITLTTVGFREVNELDGSGRLWTMLVAVAGVVVIFGTVGYVAESLILEAASGKREARRMRERVDALIGHYIVCGYGRVGATTVRELEHAGERIVVVDVNASSLEHARADGHVVVEGDATLDTTLRAAGIERAAGLVATIDSDALNVYVTLSARALNPRLFLVARANQPDAEAKLRQAGADRVVSPYTRAGRQIAELVTRPRVADYIDLALSHADDAFSLEEVEVGPGSAASGVTVGELRRRGVATLAIIAANGYEPNPGDDRRVSEGESLVVSGTSAALRALRDPVGA